MSAAISHAIELLRQELSSDECDGAIVSDTSHSESSLCMTRNAAVRLALMFLEDVVRADKGAEEPIENCDIADVLWLLPGDLTTWACSTQMFRTRQALHGHLLKVCEADPCTTASLLNDPAHL